ncbi:MAG: cyclic nucleotide-binding/CBS domain-containing protein [Candidatus Nitrosocosmicus sp.]
MSLDAVSISRLMSKNVIIAEQNQNVYWICKLLSQNNVGCLIVVNDLDEKKPVGIVTESDIVKTIGKLDLHQLQVPIKNHMSHPVITMPVSGTVTDAMRIMCEKRVRRIVIIENDKMVGIVTDKDLLKFMIDNKNVLSEFMTLSPRENMPKEDSSHFWFCNRYVG